MQVNKSNAKKILKWFEENVPTPKSELNFNNPFELIVAVILSAQCTDKRVNLVTPALLSKYPTAQKMAKASENQVYEYIKSVSYPHNKARHLVAMAKMVVADFGGVIPESIDDLVKLPGVGRKTANVVASICYDKPVIAVDTHVYRVAHRMGFSNGSTPLKVESDLNKIIPVAKRATAHHWLILHGRYICKSQKPQCDKCGVEQFCPKLLENSKLK